MVKNPVFSYTPPPLFFQYSLIKDVVSSLKKHRMHEQQFTHHPLLILNNFGSDGMQVKLMATMFQNMFPSINVHKVRFFFQFRTIYLLTLTQGFKPCWHDDSIVFWGHLWGFVKK